MKANELRIGNYYYGDVLFPSEYNVITANDLVELDSDPLDDYYQPLPLTEEWLLRMGFEKSQEQWYTIKYFTDCELATEQMAITYNLSSNRCAVFDTIEETDIVNILSYPIYTSKKVLYVHQLQNLYFALTKKELTMK